MSIRVLHSSIRDPERIILSEKCVSSTHWIIILLILPFRKQIKSFKCATFFSFLSPSRSCWQCHCLLDSNLENAYKYLRLSALVSLKITVFAWIRQTAAVKLLDFPPKPIRLVQNENYRMQTWKLWERIPDHSHGIIGEALCKLGTCLHRISQGSWTQVLCFVHYKFILINIKKSFLLFANLNETGGRFC